MSWVRWRRDYYAWLAAVAIDYDVVLLRHSLHDPFRPGAIKGIRTPVATVHHTLEVPELGTIRGVAGRSRRVVEQVAGSRSIERAGVVVGVTEEIAAYEVARISTPRPTVVYPNGAMVTDRDRASASSDSRSATPSLLFVASRFAPWHGLDRLLDSAHHSTQDFRLTVVGHTSDADRDLADGDSRVEFLEGLDSRRIESLARESWLGLSSFALDRKGMRQACPLKVREYLKSGLAVYGGHDEVFPNDVPFYRSGPADLDSILEFAHEMREVAPEKTLNAATPHIDKRLLLAKCHDDLAAALD